MTTDFQAVVSTPPSGRGTALIIDHHEFAQAAILRGNPIPWGDVTQYTSFLGQAQGLLKPDTTVIDMGALYTNLLAEMPELVDAMGASTRVGYALKTMLTDETAAGRALELTGAIAQMSEQPLVLQLPSPLRWLAQTHELAGAGSRVDIELHYGERVSAYVADWLRWLSSLPVSLLLLDGRRADLPVVRLDVSAAYAPITQVADYYDWSLGQWTDNGVEIVGAELKGAAVPREYWLSEDVAVPLGDFRIAEIPGEAELETVLARLAALG